MSPNITHVNGIEVFRIPDVGGIATVFVTPETTLKLKGTGFSNNSKIAVIGLNEVNTDTVSISVNNLKIGKTIEDLFELIKGINLDDVPGGLGDILGNLGINLGEVTAEVNMRADILRSPEARLNSQNELLAYVPSVWEFQTTSLDLFGFKCRYERNTIVIPFAICVYDSPGQHSDPVIVAAVLPLPVAGKPKITGGKILIGAVPGPSRDKTDHFGARSRGEVRWYTSQGLRNLLPFNIDGFSIKIEESTQNDADNAKKNWGWLLEAVSKPAQTVLGKATETLAAIRTKGILCEISDWNNEGVLFDVTHAGMFGDLGVVIVWRDDLPSNPVPIINLGCSDKDRIRALIQDAADKLWSFLPPFNTENVFIPGQAVTFGLHKLAQGMDNLLVRLLDSEHSGIRVKFKFKVTGDTVSIAKVVDDDDDVDIRPNEYNEAIVPGGDPKKQFQIKMLTMPHVASLENPGPDKYINIELFAEISFSSTCVFSDIRIGKPLKFKKLPITIPTIAVFFTGESCGKVPLIILSTNSVMEKTPLPNAFWDVRGMIPPQPNWTLNKADEIRIKILSTLSMLKNTLDLVDTACGFQPPAWIKQFEEIVARLAGGCSAVIDTTGGISDLGLRVYAASQQDHESFGKRIESVILIGPPPRLGGRRLKCFTDRNFIGSELKLEVPEGEGIAAFESLRTFDKLSIGGRDLPKIITTPQNPPQNYWGGSIASIQFE